MVPQRGLIIADSAELVGEGFLLRAPVLSFVVLIGEALLQLFPLLSYLLLSLRLPMLVGELFSATEGVVLVRLFHLPGWLPKNPGSTSLFQAIRGSATRSRSRMHVLFQLLVRWRWRIKGSVPACSLACRLELIQL